MDDLNDWPDRELDDEALDVAYNVRRKAGPELFERHMARYLAMSDDAVAGLPGRRGIVYDEASGERLDVWGVENGTPRPVFVFLHGGYWMALSRRESSFMARMLHENGVATVVPDYTLAPAATLEEIVRQVRESVAWVYRHGREHGLDPGRIVVGGSSAGGHLTGMTMVDGWQGEFGLPGNVVKAAMPFSGLFDIRPITRVYVNEFVKLDVPRAAALSPGLLPRGGCPAVVAAAEHDGDGFLRQTRRFARHWGVEPLIVPGRDHFDVVLDLGDAGTEASRRLLGLFAAVSG
ncbi:alpha/beta hydrolase [Actinomadura sediminis]|uniref:Alpha/beta hydrolase n=1 Tax=Actinomadura sediminis TaxID=1038904 RepID=A0ABW3EXV2_9ACTN